MSLKEWMCRRFGHQWAVAGGCGCPKGNNACSMTVYECRRCGAEDHGENAENFRRCITCTWEPPRLPSPPVYRYVYHNDRYPDRHFVLETVGDRTDDVLRAVQQADTVVAEWGQHVNAIHDVLRESGVDYRGTSDSLLFIDIKHGKEAKKQELTK